MKAVQKNKNGLASIFSKGDIFSKLSFLIMGLANIVRGQIVKGILFLAIEIGYILFMVKVGAHYLAKLVTLGTEGQGMVFDESQGIYVISQGDNSMLILLYGVAVMVTTAVFVFTWRTSICSGELARQLKLANKRVPNFIADCKELFNSNIHRLLLAIPAVGIIVFTITPLIYMILIAFTNYDAEHQPPGNLFTWVGLENFKMLLSASGKLSATFWPVLGWTFIWGFTATFSCYFGGMFLAMLINSKGIAGKKIWRTVFVITMAIPTFISLLVVSTMLGKRGIINVLLEQWGFIDSFLPFLTEGLWAKITVIIVNLWVGVPVTMLMVTGILMNIPAELYESARIDGAGPLMMFRKITFPYMWFITTPYLITNLISNFNNFGVIYFMTGGNPSNINFFKGAGKTDLLVTWLYKLTKDSKDYNLASAIGIIIFIISAVFSLIMYSRSGALKNEEGFQ
ncbi:MAG: sugar ABC transporter permease [Acetatifactor sp.]|nr:sugar ABC transporter permease [Acetatifactor sp.]